MVKKIKSELAWRLVFICEMMYNFCKTKATAVSTLISKLSHSSWLIGGLYLLQPCQMWRQFEKISALIRHLLGLTLGLYQWHADDKCPSQEAGHAGAGHSVSKATASPFWGVSYRYLPCFQSLCQGSLLGKDKDPYHPGLISDCLDGDKNPVSVRQTPAVNRHHGCCSPTSVLWGILAELRCHLVAVYGCGLQLHTDARIF